MTVFEDLLVIQEHDTEADQLRYRLAHLPEREARDRHLADVVAYESATAEVQDRRDALAREQRRLEDEVSLIEDKITEVDKTLYSGTVTAPRELQAFQDDIASLKRRQSQLEDGVIELMEQTEPLDAELEERRAARAEMDAVGGRLEVALDQVQADLVDALARVDAERAQLVGSIPDDLLVEYDKLRSQLGGIAVARLVGSNCGGCHLMLSHVALDHIRHEPADAHVYCEECGRLLVR